MLERYAAMSLDEIECIRWGTEGLLKILEIPQGKMTRKELGKAMINKSKRIVNYTRKILHREPR